MASSVQTKLPSQKIVIIVGGGLAGLSAAIEVSKHNGSLILIESQKNTGGNSAKAVSGINGCPTSAQKKLNINDNVEIFMSDTLNAGHFENDKELARIMIEKSNDAIDFLAELDLQLTEVNLGGSQSVPRTHCLPFPKNDPENARLFGVVLMRSLFSHLANYKSQCELIHLPDHVQILTQTEATELITSSENSDQVVGVKVRLSNGQEKSLIADAVILTTGGFCSDHSQYDSLLAKYRPDLMAYPSTNGAFADGSGLKMATKIGAKTVNMEKIQNHPTGFIDPADPKNAIKLMCPEALRGFGGILINKEGNRFANELDLRQKLVCEMEKHCTVNPAYGYKTAYLIVNEEIIDQFGRPGFEFYWKIKQLFKMAANLQELSSTTKIPLKNLEDTISKHNKIFRKQMVDPFGKTIFPVEFKTNQPFYYCEVTPCIHYTIGGLKINNQCQVIGVKNQPIEGLFAAGEVVGGTHGADRLSGSSLLECVVFGRLAAERALGI